MLHEKSILFKTVGKLDLVNVLEILRSSKMSKQFVVTEISSNNLIGPRFMAYYIRYSHNYSQIPL